MRVYMYLYIYIYIHIFRCVYIYLTGSLWNLVFYDTLGKPHFSVDIKKKSDMWIYCVFLEEGLPHGRLKPSQAARLTCSSARQLAR